MQLKTEFWYAQVDRYVNQLVARVAADVKVVLREALDLKLPKVFRQDLLNAAKEILREERPLELKLSDRYQATAADLKAQTELLNEQLVLATILTCEEIRRIAETAITFEIDLLVRPRHKIVELLFAGDRNQVGKEDVRRVLEEFGRNRKTITALLEETIRVPSEIVVREEVALQLKRAERRMYAKNPISILFSEIQAYLSFEENVTGEAAPTIQSGVLLTMLRERGLNAIFREFEHSRTEKDRWTLPEIESTLQRFILVGCDEQSQDNAGRGDREGSDAATSSSFEDLDSLLIEFIDDSSSGDNLQNNSG